MQHVNSRPQLDGPVRYFVFMNYDRTSDESFVIYKSFILHLWVTAIILAMFSSYYILGEHMPLWTSVASETQRTPVDTFTHNYALIAFPVISFITISYCIFMLVSKTNYFSRNSLLDEHNDLSGSGSLHQVSLHRLLFSLVFLIGTGLTLWSIPYFLQFFELYNLVYDFGAQNTANLLLYAALYGVIYQTFYCPMLLLTSILIARIICKKIYLNNN